MPDLLEPNYTRFSIFCWNGTTVYFEIILGWIPAISRSCIVMYHIRAFGLVFSSSVDSYNMQGGYNII